MYKAPEQQPVYIGGEGGYHTYRIPALLVTAKGTVLAFCEGRRNSGSDEGDIDLVLKRSFDHGVTWQDMQVVWGEKGDTTIGNPCPVQDTKTGRVWLLFCRNNSRVFVTYSDDEGATWNEPREITGDVKPDNWTWYATGPVHGIQLDSGRLLIPCDHRIADDERQYSHVVYSDDHGATWTLGGSLDPLTDECTAVQTVGGEVYLNMRSYEDKHRRAVAWSNDGGVTWTAPVLDQTLVEPRCQASAVRLTTVEDGGRNRVLFANPASPMRVKMTVRVSYDECRTWNEGKLLHEGPSAYSDLAVAADGTILCLYERGPKNPYQTITIARFGLGWLEE
ncbi:MAG: exo-alpha-sialidase [Nitrospiraceae bacterium]|nr:exo-alpha-sialidase [Nitrospiraceae bacterium]